MYFTVVHSKARGDYINAATPKLPESLEERYGGYKKFPGSDVIIKMIRKRKEEGKYIVNYEDRFLGMLDLELTDFLRSGEIPYHRVWFLKLHDTDEVVWDRKQKINKIVF